MPQLKSRPLDLRCIALISVPGETFVALQLPKNSIMFINSTEVLTYYKVNYIK